MKALLRSSPQGDGDPGDSLAFVLLQRGVWLASILAAAVMTLAGCADTRGIAPTRALIEPPLHAADGDWPAGNAWDGWSDPVLAGLIATALERQPNLQLVAARLAQAEAGAELAGAARGPQLNGAVDLTEQRFSANGLVPPQLGGQIRWVGSAQLNGSWELDLFGRQRAALASAIGQARALDAEAQAARVLLAANVAGSYVALARGVEMRTLAEAAWRQREQVLALVRQRVGAGLDTAVELRQAEGVLAQSRVEIGAADEQIERSRHALAELTGQPPDALQSLAPLLATVQPARLPQGLPADLLGRRADLVAQRWRVEAAARDVDAMRAQFYPNLNLIAFVGLSSVGLDRLLQSGSATYGAGPALRLPIFDGGRLRANLRSRSADVDAAVAGYNAALLRALREVADEAGSLAAIERQQAEQVAASTAAEAAFDLSLQRYRAGIGNFLVVLNAEGNVLLQRRNSAELKARHLAAEVALSRALGGGWRGEVLPAIAGRHAAQTAAAAVLRPVTTLAAAPV